MTTLAQKESHKKESVLRGYWKALDSHNAFARDHIRENYKQWQADLMYIDYLFALRPLGKEIS